MSNHRLPSALTLGIVPFCLAAMAFSAQDQRAWRSHPPIRSLPAPFKRPPAKGPAFYVDPSEGNDQFDGSEQKPWRTIGRGLSRLKPGATLYLRGGTYYEHAEGTIAGTADKPVTVRSYPGELAVIDGGLREFFESPAEAWEPGHLEAQGEYRSKRPYPEYARQEPRHDVLVLGNFGDSMMPLHGYRFPVDFRADNEYWNIGNKLNPDKGVYVGPGVWYDRETKLIHVRLAHIKSKAYGEDRYRGETDPRKLPLVIAGPGTSLRLQGCRHLRLQDIVVRGAVGTTVQIADCQDVTFEGVTIYGGSPAVTVESTRGLRMLRSAVRGLSAPWSSRASHKYRGISPYLLVCGQANRDFELADCEFTDNHDGLMIGTVVGMDFHHNLVENFDDDAIYLNALSTGGDIRSPEDDLQADGNLHWSMTEGPTHEGDFFAEFRRSRIFEASKKWYSPGWAAHDIFADPKFARCRPDWQIPADVRLREDSPAVNAGVELPTDWPDPLRGRDHAKPDIGAVPLGTDPPQVGPRGRKAVE